MRRIKDRLDEAESKIKAKAFRENKGLGNEVGYYVFDYPAEQELIVRDWVSEMQNKNQKGTDDFVLKVFDIYDLIIDILEEEGFLEQCFKFEKNRGFERIVRAVGNLLKVNDEESIIVKHIEDNTPENAVVFLVGIGKIYPILRSHKILNNLHQSLDRVPVVLFFPGKYDGLELVLFSKIKDDNYYRAFKLVE
ncbi:MAG: DUF1788 domain-containing protein [Saccharofermentanales bacterium]|jgi:hypothetical protein